MWEGLENHRNGKSTRESVWTGRNVFWQEQKSPRNLFSKSFWNVRRKIRVNISYSWQHWSNVNIKVYIELSKKHFAFCNHGTLCATFLVILSVTWNVFLTQGYINWFFERNFCKLTKNSPENWINRHLNSKSLFKIFGKTFVISEHCIFMLLCISWHNFIEAQLITD